MFLRDLISDWLRNKKSKWYKDLEKILGSLIDNYKRKLVLLSDFQAGRIDESVFKRNFLSLLGDDLSLDVLSKSFSHEDKLMVELKKLKELLDDQKQIVSESKLSVDLLKIKLVEERQILELEEKEIKKLEEDLLGPRISEEEIQKNIKKLKNLGFPTESYYNTAKLLATNWDLTQKLIKKTKPEHVEILFFYGLPNLVKANLIKNRDDLVLLVELAGKTKPEHVLELFKYGLPSFCYLIKNHDDLRSIGLLLIELAGKTKPEHVYYLFAFGLPFFVYLIKNHDDLRNVCSFLASLSDIVKFVDFNSLMKFGFRDIKSSIKTVNDLDKIFSMLPEFINKSHVLYRKESEEFFSSKASIVRRKFKKTGSETVLLGGKFVGKVIIRKIRESAFLAWKKAFEAKDVWEKEGFDYVPVEPILTKNEKLRAYKIKKEKYYRVFTKVLGMSLKDFINNTSDQKLITQLRDLSEKIIKVLRKELKIKHGHPHEANFCVEVQDNKIRLYTIDFDQAVS